MVAAPGARTLLKLGTFPTLRPLLPFLLTIGAASLVALPPLWPLAPVAFAAYALATGAEAVRVGTRLGVAAVPLVWAMFPVLHLSHGAGFAAGLARYLRKPDWAAEPERIAPRKVHLRAV